MGIIKFKYKDFINLNRFLKKIDNPKIDFTNFLNMSLKQKIINLDVVTTNKYWFEIDSKQDIDFASEKIW